MTEKIILQAKPSIIPTMFLPVGVIVIMVVITIAISPMIGPVPTLLATWIGIVALTIIAAILRGILEFIDRDHSVYTLTETTVIRESGVFTRKKDLALLAHVQNVNLKRPWVGNFFDYATLTISTAGSNTQLDNIPHATHWAEEIHKRIAKPS